MTYDQSGTKRSTIVYSALGRLRDVPFSKACAATRAVADRTSLCLMRYNRGLVAINFHSRNLIAISAFPRFAQLYGYV